MRRIVVHVRDEIVWVEGEHPRKGKGPGGGEFTAGPGGGSGGVVVHVHRPQEPALPDKLQTLIDRSDYEVTNEPKTGTWTPPGTRTVSLKPKAPEGWKTSGKGEVYDPAYATENEFGRTDLKDRDVGEFPAGREAGSIWRGMSQEEYQQALKQGFFKSLGDYNIGPQQGGLTYFSDDPRQAATYAHGFAPWQFSGTIKQPPVVVRVKDPGGRVNVPGTDPDEVGLKEPVPTSAIQEVWQGKPIIVGPGEYEIGPEGDLGNGGVQKPYFVWERASMLPQRQGATFASPSVAEDQDLPGAMKALSGPRQKLFEQAAADIDRELGITGQEHAVIGAWTDGAENSTMLETEGASLDQLRLSAAMKGLLGNQKAVLVFNSDPAGEAAIYHGEAKGSVEDIHKALLACGIENHTLVPGKDAVSVYIADLDGSAADGIKTYAERSKTDFTAYHGAGEFIGGDTRDEGRAAYEKVIADTRLPLHQGGDASGVWQRVRDRWAAKVAGTQDRRLIADDTHVWVEAQHPRKGKGAGGGEFTTGSGGSGGGSGKVTVSPLRRAAPDEPPAATESGMPRASRDPSRPVYLRVGEWNPKTERSSNYATGDIEAGVSVYDLDKDGEPVVPPEGEWAEADLRDRMAADDEKYLVQGDLVGQGNDGEPLLKNVRVVGLHGEKPTPLKPATLTPKQKAEANAANWETAESKAKQAWEAKQQAGRQGLADSDDPRFKGVGDKPFTGPNADRNAEYAGRLISGLDHRHAVEGFVRAARLKLVDATEVTPDVAKVFNMETWKDGTPMPTLWFEDTEVMAKGLKSAMAQIKPQFPTLANEMEGNVNVVFAPTKNGYIASVWANPKTREQWLVVNSGNTLNKDWSPPSTGVTMNTIGAMNADEAYRKAGGKPADIAEAQELALHHAMIHEMGHVLDNATGRAMSRELEETVSKTVGGAMWRSVWPAPTAQYMAKAFSDYSTTNPMEGAAEGWTKIVTQPQAKFPKELLTWRDHVLQAAKSGAMT